MSTIKRFDKDFFSRLTNDSAVSSRRRANSNVHTSYDDPIQRLFIHIQPDSYVRPHQHSQANKWEFFFVVSGRLSLLTFDSDGVVCSRDEIGATGACHGVEIPANCWHTVVPGSQSATFFEVKPGPYQALTDKEFAPWAPDEGDSIVSAYLAHLKAITVGDVATTEAMRR